MPFLSSKQQLPEYCTNCILSMSYRNAAENEELNSCFVALGGLTGKNMNNTLFYTWCIFSTAFSPNILFVCTSVVILLFLNYTPSLSYVRFYDLRELFSYIEDARQDIWKPRDSVRFIAVVTRCDLFSWSRTTLTRMSSS